MIYAQTPARITKEIAEGCAQIAPAQKPIFLRITQQPWSVLQECYQNVERAVQTHGGSVVYGWNVFLWPRIWIELTFRTLDLSRSRFFRGRSEQVRNGDRGKIQHLWNFLSKSPADANESHYQRVVNLLFSLRLKFFFSECGGCGMCDRV